VIAVGEPVVTSALATRVATGFALVAAVLAALFLLPPAGWGTVALLVVVGAAREWARLGGLTGAPALLFAGVVLVAGAAILWVSADGEWLRALVLVACGFATLFWLALGTPSVMLRWLPASAIARATTGWIVLLGAFVAVVAMQARSPWLVLCAMAIVWIADTAAYFTGRRFGRHKLAPQISPGKTWEGACGGIAAVVVYALALLPLAARAGLAPLDGGHVALWVLFAVALAALSIVGDLYESLLKRRAGVKDSGTLLPGHGGILDRTDALIAAMPPAALAAAFLLAPP
jgi:phosphatidate cytidylyltransferase